MSGWVCYSCGLPVPEWREGDNIRAEDMHRCTGRERRWLTIRRPGHPDYSGWFVWDGQSWNSAQATPRPRAESSPRDVP